MGTKIYDSKDIYKFKNKIDQILFAIPSLSKENSKNILELGNPLLFRFKMA